MASTSSTVAESQLDSRTAAQLNTDNLEDETQLSFKNNTSKTGYDSDDSIDAATNNATIEDNADVDILHQKHMSNNLDDVVDGVRTASQDCDMATQIEADDTTCIIS